LLVDLIQKDLHAYTGVRVVVRNLGSSFCRVDARIGEDWQTMTSAAFFEPKSRKDIDIVFKRNKKQLPGADVLFPGMNGIPEGGLKHWIDVDYSSDIDTLFLQLKGEGSCRVLVESVEAYGNFQTPQDLVASHGDYFPFVDEFGQYKHGDWDGKIHRDEDFKRALEDEAKDLAQHPGPKDRSAFGGWLGGPRLRKTGDFYTSKVDGQWWFVDPEGYLFWSYGVTGVSRQFASTLIETREKFFSEIPDLDEDLGQFSNPSGHTFAKRRSHSCGMANLYKKYGKNWAEEDRRVTGQRMVSWGLNSLGNWSDIRNQGDQKLPYTTAIHFAFPKIIDSLRCPDVFNPSLEEVVDRQLAGQTKHNAEDSYNIGYFIDNELRFAPSGSRKHFDVCEAYLSHDLDSPGRRAMVDHLRHYFKGSIGTLNRVWATDHKSFEAVKTIPFSAKAVGESFESHYADLLYKMYRRLIKKHAPHKLYMGSRFVHSTPAHIMEAAAPHVDVFSINWYRSSPDECHLPHVVDKPAIIGEIHFRAVDLGVFYPGLVAVGNQEQRADNMYYYYQDALLHQNIVGAHWFQYHSQAFTGRKDGECYQIGMVDIADNPNPQQRQKLRQMGRKLYRTRSSGRR
jgi:hypothetical protein